MSVKNATLNLLRAFGIQKVFGNPGSTELPFLSDWPDDIDYVLGLQEASVIGMADGYAQATRNAGFVNLHSAAGVGNALGNIYTAHRNQTPLVITAGQQARSILPLQPFLYAERASEFPRPYVKFSVEPARAEDVPAAIARAYYVAMQPPCGPTFVSVPIDDWTRPAQSIEARQVSRELGPDPAAMKSLVAAVFTFHVEGHASIFDGATSIFQITDDPTAAAVSPFGVSIIATIKPALTMLLDLLPETKRAVQARRTLPPAPAATNPIVVEFLLHTLSQAMPDDAALVEEAPSHRPAMQNFMPMRGQDSFYTMASGGLGYSLPASVGMALGRPDRRTVCLVGDGSAMYSIQALWTAAQRKLPLTVVVINNAGYGAMRSFSQVMQVRDVPGLDLPGVDFVRIAQGLGCDAVRVGKSSELAPALKRSLAHDGVSLIDVMVDSAVPLLYAQKS